MKSFLESRKTNGTNYNFLSQRDKCKYLIEDDDIDEFLTLYKKEPSPSISQRIRPQGHITVRGDFDIKLPISMDVPNFYTRDEVARIIEIYQDQLRKLVKKIDESQLTCYVLEKPVKITETHQKKGFHLEFPYLFITKDELKAIIIPSIKKEYKESNIFSRWNDDSIFDEQAVVSNPWLMYGSVKKDGEPYRVSYSVNCKGQEDDVKEVEIETFFINVNYKTKHFIRDCIRDTTVIRQEFKPIVGEKKEYTIPQSNTDYLQECKAIRPLINASTMEDYSSWRNIGQALYDLTGGSLDGMDLFIEMSAKAKNFSELSCINLWKKIKPIGYNIGVLYNLAKRDSPNEYSTYKQSKSKKCLCKSIDEKGQLTSVSCAQSLYLLFKDEFIYCPDDKEFYQYHTNRWNKINKEGHELRKKIEELKIPISKEINKIRDKIKEIEDEKEDENGSKQKKELDKKRGLYIKERNKLEDTPFREKIIKECKDLFLDREFFKVKDSNQYLLGFTNGVLDLHNKVFRNGQPDDYITMSTGYEYQEQSHDKINLYFSQVFIKDELRHYAYNFLASCLEGRNKNKKMLFFTGVGDNSKSLLETIIQRSFGSYSGLLPVSYFTAKKQGATPEINKVKQCRIVFINEPSDKDQFDIGLLKELSGNDSIQTRRLFNESDDNTSPVLFKPVVLCNKLPQIPSDDPATWNRIRVLPFESKFVEEVKNEGEFKKEVNFEISIEFQQAFMSKLFSVYKEGYDSYEPEDVKYATNKFQAKNDHIQHFIRNGLIKDTECTTTIIEAWGSFRTFWKSEYPDTKFTMVKDEFMEYIKKHFKLTSNYIQGYKIASEEEEVEKQDEIKVDIDIEKWNEIIKNYQTSTKFIRQKDFFKEHEIHISLGRKKFPSWFLTTGFTIINDTNSNKLFIELKK